MSESKLGFGGAVSIGLGGMIGGGVFSVLGVVVTVAGSAAWLAFTAASLVSMCAAYSYIKLNEVSGERGGSVTQLEHFLDNAEIAGMVGWTLLVGYIGAIAMYAYAFAEFAVRLTPEAVAAAVPLVGLRPLFSVLVIGGFVALNVLGARATGTSEKLLVGLKVGILFAISAWGLYYAGTQGSLELGLGQLDNFGLVTATAISFVSFQGWQLVVYDQDSIEDPESTVPKAIYVSIIGAIVIDSMVAILETSLVPADVIRAHPEVAVARAVEPFLGPIGFTFVALAALFSTGSAINGTLFSSANFTKRMLSDGLVPDSVGRVGADGVPSRTVLILGALAALFAVVGSLDAITSFGSLAFMIVFGAMSALAFTQRDHDAVNPVVPALGVLGTALFFPLLLYHFWVAQRGVFYMICLIAVAVVAVELLYFERETIEEGVVAVEKRVAN